MVLGQRRTSTVIIAGSVSPAHKVQPMGRLLRRDLDGIRAMSAVLDAELVCFDRDGLSNFHELMFRRD
jgi:hypothetical protein